MSPHCIDNSCHVQDQYRTAVAELRCAGDTWNPNESIIDSPGDNFPLSAPTTLSIEFLKPVFLPSTVIVRVWHESSTRRRFEVLNTQQSVCQAGFVDAASKF